MDVGHDQAEHPSGLLRLTADLTLDTDGFSIDTADLLEHLPHAITGITARPELADSTDTICLVVECAQVQLS